MKTTWRVPALAAVLAIGGLLGADPGEARAQYPSYPAGTVIVPAAPVLTTGRTTYVFSRRRALKGERRYVAQRPVYGGRRPLTFAPYSDHYNTDLFAPPVIQTYPVSPR